MYVLHRWLLATMDRYNRVEKPKDQPPAAENEVSGGARVLCADQLSS